MSQKQNKQPEQSQEIANAVLSPVKVQQLNKQPAIETSVRLSKNGKWLIYKTTITDVKAISYFEKVLAGPKTE